MNEFTTGNLIRSLRLERKYSQRRLAEVLDISHKEVQAWEDGQVIPSDETLEELALLFQVTYEELINGKLSVPEDPLDVYIQWIIQRLLVYGGLFVTLFGLSLYIFALASFVVHLFVIVFGILFARFVLFRVNPRKPRRQYIVISGLLTVLIVTLVIVNPNYYSIRREEYIRIDDIKEHLYLRELDFETQIVIYYDNMDEMYAIVYKEDRPNFDIINLSRYHETDIQTIPTNQERVIDILWVRGMLYVSTAGEASDDEYTIYEYDPNDLTKEVIFQADKVYDLYLDHSEIVMISHPYHNHNEQKVFYYDQFGNFELNQNLLYRVLDLQEYMIGDFSYYLASTTGEYVDNTMTYNLVVLDKNTFEVQEVLLDNLKNPLYFEGTPTEMFAYNEDAIYELNDSQIKKVFGIDGFYEFTIIKDGLYYADHAFYDERFNVIQKNSFYDDELQRFEFGRKMIPDGNNNMYTLDNEFIGFGVQMYNEIYRWVLPIGLRIVYLVLSIAIIPLCIRFGQITRKSPL